MTDIRNVVIIGTGNVAHVLGRKIMQAGCRIIQVYGRDLEKARLLSIEMKADPVCQWQDIIRQADLYLVAIADQALPDLKKYLSLEKELVVHTAGSVSMEVLAGISSAYGVLYPLQSLRKEIDPVVEIPLLVEGCDGRTLDRLLQFAGKLSSKLGQTDSQNRLKLHVAAVVVNNFTNHLYAQAEFFCEKEHLDSSLLYPLIRETALRLAHHPARDLQTGPAARNDQDTVRLHLEVLQQHPALQQLYQVLTESITENR